MTPFHHQIKKTVFKRNAYFCIKFVLEFFKDVNFKS